MTTSNADTVEEGSIYEDIKSVMENTPEVTDEERKARNERGQFISKDEPEDPVQKPDEVKAPDVSKEPEKKGPESEPAPKAAEPEKKPDNQPQEPEKVLTQDKAPIGWSPKVREQWASLPEDVRKEVLKREEASINGVRQLHQQYEPYKQFADGLGEYIKEAVDNKVNPGQYIAGVMKSERSLRVGTDSERFSALCDIAENYGIPLRKIINEAAGQELVAPSQKIQLPADVQRELEEARRFRQEYEAKQQQQQAPAEDPPELVEFAKTHKYFQDVRLEMAHLFQTGRATDLESAYNEALWMNPGTREVMMAEQTGKNAQTDKQRKALGVKTTSSNAAETGNDMEHDEDDDTAATVRKAMAAHAGRV